MWVQIIEKAWSKMKGNYLASNYSNHVDTIHALIGFVEISVRIKEEIEDHQAMIIFTLVWYCYESSLFTSLIDE